MGPPGGDAVAGPSQSPNVGAPDAEPDAAEPAEAPADAPAEAAAPTGFRAAVGRAWSRAASHPVRSTALIGVVVAARNLVWIARHRMPGGFDGDEAGYLATTLRFNQILFGDGLGSLFEAARSNPRNGPLLSLISAPFVVPGHEIGSAIAVQPVLQVIAAIAVAGIARRLAGDAPALVAGIVALGLPSAVHAARSYQLVPGVTAALALAVWALLASDRGRARLPMLAMGASVGALLLARTMTITFLPGLAVAVLIVVTWSRRTIANLALAAVATLVIAGPWWLHEWDTSIGPYLFRYGYGQGAGELGPANPVLRMLVRLGLVLVDVRYLLLIPAAIVVVVALWRVVQVLRSGGWPRLRGALADHRDLVAVASVVVVGWVGLLSSSNIGTWFQLPLEVLAIPVVVSVAALASSRWSARLGPVVVAAAALNVVLLSVWPIGAQVSMGDGTSLSLIAFGGVETSQAIDFEAGDERFAPTASQAEREAAMREWASSAEQVAAAVDSLTPPGGEVIQTFVGDIRLMQPTTVVLAEQLTGLGRSTWEAPTGKSTIGDGKVSYDPTVGSQVRIIIAVRSRLRDPQEGYSPEPVIAEARRKGYVVARTVPLPDGGEVLLMVHEDELDALPGPKPAGG